VRFAERAAAEKCFAVGYGEYAPIGVGGFQPVKTEWLNKYDAILNEMASMAEVEAFKFGFRLVMAIINDFVSE